MEIKVSTSNTETFVKLHVVRIVYQLCEYTDLGAVFLKTEKRGKRSVFANEVTFIYSFPQNLCTWDVSSLDSNPGPSDY